MDKSTLLFFESFAVSSKIAIFFSIFSVFELIFIKKLMISLLYFNWEIFRKTIEIKLMILMSLFIWEIFTKVIYKSSFIFCTTNVIFFLPFLI